MIIPKAEVWAKTLQDIKSDILVWTHLYRLEKAAAKLPKKDLAAAKKRYAFLEV